MRPPKEAGPMRMVLQSLSAAAVLLAGYEGLLRLGLSRAGVAASPWEDNRARTEEHILAPAAPRVILAGSSITVRLAGPSAEWRNLGQNGGSVFTGLHAAELGPAGVEAVVIEVNHLGMQPPRPVDSFPEFRHPVAAPLMRRVGSLQIRSRPANVAGRFVLRGMVRVGELLPRPQPEAAPAPAAATAPAPTSVVSVNFAPAGVPSAPAAIDPHAEMLRQSRLREGDYLGTPDPEFLDAQIDELIAHIGRLEARGVRCVLMEVPEEPVVMRSPFRTQVRRRLHERLPAGRYTWLPDVRWEDYSTTDGTHLGPDDARRFGRILADFVEGRGGGSGHSPKRQQGPTAQCPC
jgi:hypothetical protein